MDINKIDNQDNLQETAKEKPKTTGGKAFLERMKKGATRIYDELKRNDDFDKAGEQIHKKLDPDKLEQYKDPFKPKTEYGDGLNAYNIG